MLLGRGIRTEAAERRGKYRTKGKTEKQSREQSDWISKERS